MCLRWTHLFAFLVATAACVVELKSTATNTDDKMEE
jgi:hypothetical protein